MPQKISHQTRNSEKDIAPAEIALSGFLENYINKCTPPMGWDKAKQIDFFELIGLIWESLEPCRQNIGKLLLTKPLEKSIECIDKEFKNLMSANRRELIKRCLRKRQELLIEAVTLVK